MAKKPVIKFTANFERNLERFPDMGRPFMLRQPRSVETTNALAALRANRRGDLPAGSPTS